MTITHEEVVESYRAFFGRDPESQEVIQEKQRLGSLEELLRELLNSSEFASRHGLGLPVVGTHNGVQELQGDVDATPAELAAMLANIRREWRRFGETDPHWSVLTSPEFRADKIHATSAEFYRSGFEDLQLLLNPLSRAGISADQFKKVLDFGCGVGRLSLALASVTGHVDGVDISSGHIRLAQEQARASGIDNVRFHVIQDVDDLDAFGGFDLVVSLIVLQHNPPPIIAELLRKLLAALAPGGCAVIQIPTYLVAQQFRVQAYLAERQPAMEMNALPQHHIFRIIEEADCAVLEVRQDRAIGPDLGLSHTFAVRRH